MLSLLLCLATSFPYVAQAGSTSDNRTAQSLNTLSPAAGNPSGPIVHATNDFQDMVLTYNIYAGGMHALTAQLNMDTTTDNYDVALKAQTKGFIGKLFPWAGDYTTTGLTQDNKLSPTIHKASSKWKKKLKQTELEYQANGDFKEKRVKKNGKTTTQSNIKSELTLETVDMLTGILSMLQQTGNTHSCGGSAPVFDGKRRFNITFKDDGIDTIKKSKYSTFSGPALRCIIDVKPVAGFKKKDQKRGWMAIQNHTNKRKKPPTIWLAQLEENGPVVPVRMEIRSDYGAVIAHLRQKSK